MASNSKPSCSRTVISIQELERHEDRFYQLALRYIKTLVDLGKKKEKLLIEKDQGKKKLLGIEDNQDMLEVLDTEMKENEDQEMLATPDSEKQALAEGKGQNQKMLQVLNTNEEKIKAGFKDAALEVDIQINECHRDVLLLEDYIIDHRMMVSSGSIMVTTLRESTDHLINLEEVIYGIMQDEVTEEPFCNSLNILNLNIGFLRKDNRFCNWHDDAQCYFIFTTLTWLKRVAIHKIEKFLMKYISMYYIVLTDCQHLENLSVFRQFYKFIESNEPKLSEKVIDNYVTSKKDIYTAHFKMLIDEIQSICDSKNICAPSSIYMATNTGKNEQEIMKYFVIGSRTQRLIDMTKADELEDENLCYLDDLFKNFHVRLVDITFKENTFVQKLFQLHHKERLEVIDRMMAQILSALPHFWKKCLDSMDDLVTPFMCFHLAHQFEALCKLNDIEHLNKYWKIMEKITLCRLGYITFLNIHSMTSYAATNYKFDFRPHYAVSRYATYAAEVARVQKAFRHKVIIDLMNLLRKTVYEFSFRVAKSISNDMHQLVFVINNFQDIIDTITDALDNQMSVKVFLEQLPVLGGRYVYAILNRYYGDMQRYLNEVGQYVDTENHDKIAEYMPVAEKIIKKFNANWKKNLEEIHLHAELPFVNVATGIGILLATRKAYHRMLSRFTKAMRKSSKWSQENLVAVLVELKKYDKKYEVEEREMKEL